MRCGVWLGQLRRDRNFPVRRHQKSLARRLGLKEQQIQRYEASEYASASLARVLSVVEVLGEG